MKSLIPVLIIGAVLLVLVFAARCSQRAMHNYETRAEKTTGAAGGPETSANPNSMPNELVEQQRMAERFPDTLLSTTGMRFRVMREGAGEKPIAGRRVQAHYIGRLLDGTEFDNSYRRGQPYEFVLMAGGVIRGWDQTVIDMRVGERRFVVIPYRLGYGERGNPPDIPPRATLVFEIELVGVR
jgi:FKBP-type peptidyl-prolyl cis-trans isomerase